MIFEYPYVYLAIIPFILCNKFCKAKIQSYYLPHINIYNNTRLISSPMLNLLKWVTIVCTLIALSSPIKQSEIIHKKNDGIDIVLCLDTSGSMRQMGFNKQNYRQNRWDVVNGLVKDFIVKRKNDNIGLVVFGSSVMTASPLTYDKKAQIKILNNLKIGVVGENTALIDSIATGVNILSKRESKSRIIIALTDGEDTASVIPYKVVESMSKKHKIKIYTIGIGEPNQLLLSEISKKSGGKSFIANNKDHLEEIYKHINKLEKSDIEQNKIILKEYYFFYPLTLSFFSLLLFVFIKNKY